MRAKPWYAFLDILKETTADRRARSPRSGYPFVDWFFTQFVRLLRRTRIQVVYHHDLKLKSGEVICGETVFTGSADGGAYIYLNPDEHKTSDDEITTLIHELLHVLLHMEFTPHSQIWAMEYLLVAWLTQEQRDYLKRFLPDRASAERATGCKNPKAC